MLAPPFSDSNQEGGMMSPAISYVNVTVDGATQYQPITGFGVNINSKYWGSPSFERVMELLLDDLGATLFRVDVWGKSNWIDPTGEQDAGVLNDETYRAVYGDEVFQKGWAMMRYLNERGVEPYLTASGDVPAWMLGKDGKTLADYDRFCEMLASMVEWAKRKEGLRFTYFGPLNETDEGSPEGPSVPSGEFVKVMEMLDGKLAERGLDDVRLVVPEQASFDTDYVRELVASERLPGRIGAFGMHTYRDLSTETYAGLVNVVASSRCAGTPIWLSEYGDLDQTGEKEWYVAWVSTARLLGALEGGFNGAMAWDAFDNYHDHDEAWTIYGLIRTGLRVYTPKKRYYAAKQVYRTVRPGFVRVGADCTSEAVRLLAFADLERTQVTLVGMNTSPTDVYLHATLEGFDPGVTSGRVAYYRTTEAENCARAAEVDVTTANYPSQGIDVHVPAQSIFTLTNVA
jgi:O-glycosyl hydrolase